MHILFVLLSLSTAFARPAMPKGMSWWWQLSGTVPTNRPEKAIDLDLFDVPAADIKKMRDRGQIVICYFSAGSYEAWRPDAESIPKAARGKKMDGWDELWLNVRDKGVRSVMKKRMELAKKKGCHGVEPDNVDAYANSTGFNIQKKDSIDYLKFMSKTAHDLDLVISLKNSTDIAAQVEPYFDFIVIEECARYNECGEYEAFTKAGKAAFQAEYMKYKQSTCDAAKKRGFSLTFFTQGTDLNGKGMVPCK